METKASLIYEYSLLRYVPDIERGEYINIGLMMMCKRLRWIKVSTYLDRNRIAAFDPQCDFDRLSCQLEVFERCKAPSPDLPVEERYRWMSAVKSAFIQTSPSHPGIILPSEFDSEDPRLTLDSLFHRLFHRLVK